MKEETVDTLEQIKEYLPNATHCRWWYVCTDEDKFGERSDNFRPDWAKFGCTIEVYNYYDRVIASATSDTKEDALSDLLITLKNKQQ